MSNPSVSVVMPVLNGEQYLKPAIDSILHQDYSNFELIIVDDGSKDKTAEILSSINDKRLRIITHKSNLGVSLSRNQAVAESRAKYIAMHDADDLSAPTRLSRQVEYLEEHPEIGLLGTCLEVIDPKGELSYCIDLLTNQDDLKLAEIFSNQLGQGSVMVRRNIFKQSGGYDSSLTHAEDTELWRRISHITELANLKDRLYKYRVHDAGVSTDVEKIRASALKTTEREFSYYLSNRNKYRFFSFHPLSMNGGMHAYLGRKSSMYGLMSLLYARKHHRIKALLINLFAIAHAPWVKKNYRQLSAIAFGGTRLAKFRYDFF